MYCAARPRSRITKSDIATACNASEHHLGQIVNQLAQLGYLETFRGRHGGIALGRRPEDISIGRLFRDFESGMPIAECFSSDSNTCPLIDACRLRPALALAAEAFFQALDKLSLDTLTEGNAALIDLFSDPGRALRERVASA
jgi:Rrf2 family nitric oxide-sensitive transcriptional repressor